MLLKFLGETQRLFSSFRRICLCLLGQGAATTYLQALRPNRILFLLTFLLRVLRPLLLPAPSVSGGLQVADTKQVTIPGTKTKVSKPVAAGAVGLVGIGIIYYYTKQKKASAAVPAATSTNQYPPDGTTGDPSDPYSTDPATGQTYGDEAVGSNSTLGAYGSGAARPVLRPDNGCIRSLFTLRNKPDNSAVPDYRWSSVQ